MKISQQQQFIAWIALGALLIAAGSWYVFSPLHASMQSTRTKILEARITTELQTRQQQNLSAQKGQVDQIVKNIETLDAAFFDRSKALAFLESIEKLAETEKLELAEPQVAEPSRKTVDSVSTYTIEEKAFQFDLRGPIPALMRFMRTLETLPAYILVQNVSLAGGQSETGTLTLEGVIPWH